MHGSNVRKDHSGGAEPARIDDAKRGSRQNIRKSSKCRTTSSNKLNTRTELAPLKHQRMIGKPYGGVRRDAFLRPISCRKNVYAVFLALIPISGNRRLFHSHSRSRVSGNFLLLDSDRHLINSDHSQKSLLASSPRWLRLD